MEVDGAMSSPRRHQWRTTELGGGVRAREAGGWGWLGGRLGASGPFLSISARAVWAATPGDVQAPRRLMARGRRRTGECGLATWRPQRLWTSRTGARRRGAATSGYSGPSACAPIAGKACTAVADVAARATSRQSAPGAPRHFLFAELIFKHDFL
jgi:hypothetical protein